MRLPALHASRLTHHVSRSRLRESGSAVVVVLALLVIITVYVASNLRTLASLGRELKLLEHQQTRRLQVATRATNAPPAITVATNVVPASPAE